MEPAENGRPNLLVAVVLLAVVVGGVADLALDAPRSWLTLHVGVEVAVILLSLGLSVHLWGRWRRAERSLERLGASLAERRDERDAWRERARHALEGLGEAIDEQFDAWELTPSEREVALHLLKGRSHKQIARVTDRSERTVRQHAVNAYRKAGVSGRAELSAFFLEDLFLPDSGVRARVGETETVEG